MADRRKNVKRDRDAMQEGEDDSLVDSKTRGKQLQFEQEMQFEDPYEDDEEEDEEVVDANEHAGLDEADVSMMDEDDDEDDEENVPTKAFVPGIDNLEEGGEMEYDSNAYDMMHFMKVEWPCLSFDIITDELGGARARFPHTAYAVSGTQADIQAKNRIYVMKLSQMHKTKHDGDESDDDNDEEDDVEEEDAILELKQITHAGAVNRIRSMPQRPHIVVTMSENKHNYIYDISKHLRALDNPTAGKLKSVAPLQDFGGHQAEGFGVAWNGGAEGVLLTGDQNGKIHLWVPQQTAWAIEPEPFSHGGSVEDLCWNPGQAAEFASCSTDSTIKIWDHRQKNGAGLTWKADSSDVNVISWNARNNNLIASGGDSGQFCIWDLRRIASGSTDPSLSFGWHKAPICSIEWNPNEDSELVVASADNTISLWDIALTPEEARDELDAKVPTQLLFLHQGQQDPKECHWHKQIPGVICSTGYDGFNVFKPNVTFDPNKGLDEQ